MQLTRMRVDDNVVDLDGVAMDNTTIAEFMTRLGTKRPVYGCEACKFKADDTI